MAGAGRGPAARGNRAFTAALYRSLMPQPRAIAELEADIVALRAAADRAGTALACLFSSSDEFEAAVVRLRREQGAYGTVRRDRRRVRVGILIAILAAAFVMM
jgi:hypothetical protein